MQSQVKKSVRVSQRVSEFYKTYSHIDRPTTKIIQEFDGYGNHRLTANDGSSDCQKSNWVSYQSISELRLHDVGIFRGTSEYYEGVLPGIFEIALPLVK